jgi:hypothetical protein
MKHWWGMADTPGSAEPELFAAFLADRGTRKPSAHTMKAYRQDFDAIAEQAGGEACTEDAIDTQCGEVCYLLFAR